MSTEPTYGDTMSWDCFPNPWDTTDRCGQEADDDGSWDFSCD
ncbi:MAG: hypothetical protein V4472_16480 [Pseudomonadota bacterium]